MSDRKLVGSSILILVVFLISGCTTVHYAGQTLAPTMNVEMFFSVEEITEDYSVIGLAIGGNTWGSLDTNEIQEKLIKVARKRGADAVLITGISRDNFFLGGGWTTSEVQINAEFLKYK